mgnify:CR=1 FL=1
MVPIIVIFVAAAVVLFFESGEGVSFGICDCGRGCAYDAGFDNKSKARTKCRKE